MPRTNRGKTKTVKQRAIYVYLPSLDVAKDWKDRASKAGTSISKFVTERVEDSIRREEGEESYLNRLDLIKRLDKTEEELKKLRNENRLLKKLVDNLDTELKRHRAKPFLEEGFEGERGFDKELINLLRKGDTYSGDEILTHLNVDPSDTEFVKAVNNQLEILEKYGLVRYVGRGWKFT